jgi:DNA-binding NarL/FixJ family response regulator
MVKLLIVDDHEVVRVGLKRILGAMPEISIVGVAASATEALVFAGRTAPEIAVIDFRLSDMPGDELATKLRAGFPRIGIVMLTAYAGEDIVRRALAAGVDRFVTKGAGSKALRTAIESLLCGEPMPCGGAGAVLRQLASYSSPAVPAGLTPRQKRVLELAADGMSDGEIADCLFISESTVRFHMQALKSKLGVRTRAALIATAIREALVDPAGSGAADLRAPSLEGDPRVSLAGSGRR